MSLDRMILSEASPALRAHAPITLLSTDRKMDDPSNPLLTDLYQLNMMQAYLDHGDTGTAVFEFFMRKLPARRGFLMAAGLEQALDFLENLHFSPADIDWLAQTGRFGKACSTTLRGFALPATYTPCPRERFSSPTSQSSA